MNWIALTDLAQLESIDKASTQKPQLLFKHSTRCSISVTAKARLDKASDRSDIDCYYLDLLNHRDISSAIAERYHVHHESPQVILIKNAEAIYDESHLGISWQDIEEQANATSNAQ